jgi:UPF0755 protein
LYNGEVRKTNVWNSQERGHRPGKWRRGVRNAILLLLLAVILLAGGATYYTYREFAPPQSTGRLVDVDIAKGESTSELGQELQRIGLIRNAWVFRMYVRFRDGGDRFLAGHYQVRQGTGIPELVSIFADGAVVSNAVSVTIPEGYTVVQIADKLAALNVCSKSAFLKEVQSGSFNAPFLSKLPHNPAIKYRLEGYLFPDTYQFVRGESAHTVVQEMLNDFAEHVNASVLQRLQKAGLTLPQAITEASLVEKEAKVNRERPIIASVIQNRLHKSMKLQIDATLEYILGHKDVLSTKDTEVNDPYNTYRNPGLPPGPIANPGMASILAVIQPAHTSYLYYVVKNDGTGEHYFAETYPEQLHNEALSQKNLHTH